MKIYAYDCIAEEYVSWPYAYLSDSWIDFGLDGGEIIIVEWDNDEGAQP